MTRTIDLSKFPTLDYEHFLWTAGFGHIAGIDEAGRGAWAGPVCAAVVVLPPSPGVAQALVGVRDSKLMTALAREAWAPHIKETSLAWGVGFASTEEIDALGIVRSTKLAAWRALSFLPFSSSPDYLLTDYLLFPELELPQTALIKGDRLSLSVAAASVLAKTSRDAWMRELDKRYPGYGLARHKGYGTLFHRDAIKRQGMCEVHRKSFTIPI